MLDYTPLWETMQRKKISQYSLLKAGIDNKTLDDLKKETTSPTDAGEDMHHFGLYAK